MSAKRLKLQGGGDGSDAAGLATLLQRLRSCLLTPSEAGALDELLDQLDGLSTTLNGSSDAAFKSIAHAQERLQAAIVSLQAAVDRYTPPPGYRPPVAGDAAYVRGLLSYAHRLSYSSSAPLGYQPGQPLYFFKPPAPQEGEMRASQLHAFAREWEERQRAQEAQRQAAAHGAAVPAAPQQPAAPPVPAAPPAAAAPAGGMAAMAAQHGLDVQQLLASMPAGWKPGDPIPAGPAASAAAAAAQQPPATLQPQPQPVLQQGQREASQEDEGPASAATAAAPLAAPRAVPAAPPLAGIFLNADLNFEQYDYVSDDGEEDSDEEQSSDGSE